MRRVDALSDAALVAVLHAYCEIEVPHKIYRVGHIAWISSSAVDRVGTATVLLISAMSEGSS